MLICAPRCKVHVSVCTLCSPSSRNKNSGWSEVQAKTQCFFVAPRSNFPKGLSTEQQKWLVTKGELLARYEVHDDDTDFDNMFVFSDACPRATLGKFVHQLKFSLKLASTMRVPRTAANKEAASPTAASNAGLELGVAVPPPATQTNVEKTFVYDVQ